MTEIQQTKKLSMRLLFRLILIIPNTTWYTRPSGKGWAEKKKNYMYIYFGLGMQAEQRIQDAVLRI